MTNIELNKLTLQYFKSVQNAEYNFKHVTNIFGDNGVGKTTIAESLSWLLFGTNLSGATNFNIKTIINGVELPKVDHSVEGVFDINGEETVIKRVLREKWVKKRGALDAEFSGNVTDYFWNNVPLSKAEFENKINSIINPTVFKLITDPLAFSALHWEKQRQILIDIVGNVNDSDIASGNKDFEALMNKLSNKTLEEYTKEVDATRARLNKEIKVIPTRIDEVRKNMPEIVNFKDIEEKINTVQESINKVDEQIQDRTKSTDEAAAKRTAKSNELHSLKSTNQNIEFDVKKEIRSSLETGLDSKEDILKAKVENLSNKETEYSSLLSGLKNQRVIQNTELSEVVSEKEGLRHKWDEENAKELKFDEGSFNCPTCNRPLEASDVEEEKAKMLKDFNTDKNSALEKINTKGVQLAAREKELNTSISKLNERISTGEKNIEEITSQLSTAKEELKTLEEQPKEAPADQEELLKKALLDNKEYQSNLSKINTISEELKEPIKQVDVSDLKETRSNLEQDLRGLNSILANKALIEKAEERIEELTKSEKEYAQQIANLEKQQFVIKNFNTEKANKLEGKVNALFNKVSVKMFKEQIDGIKDWLYVLVDGVPFSDVNTAGKVNGGLEIINALSKFYQITGMIFIDNRESVVNLIDTESQIINLIVLKEVLIEDDNTEKLTFFNEYIEKVNSIEANGGIVLRTRQSN